MRHNLRSTGHNEFVFIQIGWSRNRNRHSASNQRRVILSCHARGEEDVRLAKLVLDEVLPWFHHTRGNRKQQCSILNFLFATAVLASSSVAGFFFLAVRQMPIAIATDSFVRRNNGDAQQ